MPVLNDEVPDEGDFDAGRKRGEFDAITPEDFVRGSSQGNPPGWLGPEEIDRIRGSVPIPYVEIVPVHTDELGRLVEIGSLLRVRADGSLERTLIAGRVLFHENLREAIARNIAKDFGELALPTLPQSMTPFTVAEFFPTPGLGDYYDPRQHAIALCYVVPLAGDCKPQDQTLDIQWCDPHGEQMETFIEQMVDGHGAIVRKALAWAGI
ncbi:DUF4916 domain-containing protein [Bifidobacterium aemilianum]|uniref:DUF4916 domain-containing protein n=1 Tax=Bifidobacterium aemilianum TaxID=2493120 RepID=A0A366K6V4_9BIFI|nr:DUF4916 domain-containing protein [Bifidobacterium aemilianum]RBP97480.1 DUF4916 domain-containing protein [Bifidobacterium aemilianum]